MLAKAAGTALALLLCAVPAAPASSIAFVRDGDVWLSSPDGAQQYRVTTGGGWRSPSQADDGTLLAQRGRLFVRMDRSGQVLSTSEGVGGDTPTKPGTTQGFREVYGPYDPKLSPDGQTVAYWFRAKTTDAQPGEPGEGSIDDWVTSQPVGQTEFPTPDTAVQGDTTPAWIDSRRVLVTAPWATGGLSVSTWVAGGDYSNEQWWFTDPNAILQDGELSPDGTKAVAVAATHGAASPFDGVRYYVQDGPVWTHEPPYENVLGSDDFPEPPAPVCQDTRDSEAHSPTWSPDSSAVAYDDGDGIWIQPVRADLDGSNCESLESRLLLPGGREPDWGPADVDPSQAPRDGGQQGPAPAGGPAPGGAPAPGAVGGGAKPAARALRSIKVARRVSRRRRVRIAFRLARAAKVTFVLRHGRKVRRFVVAGRPGLNVKRIARLPRGRWSLTATADGATLRATFRVR
jgi:hypothetical protein